MTVEIVCPYCHFSKEVPREKIPAAAKTAKCPGCHQRFALVLSEPEAEDTVKTDFSAEERGLEDKIAPQGAPWERRTEIGFWRSIYETVKDSLFNPEAFFQSQQPEDRSKEPFAFGLLLGSIGTMFGLFWQFLILSEGISLIHPNALGQVSFFIIFLGIMFIVPLLVSLGLFLYAGILHLLLAIVKGGKKGFKTTFRVVCYSQAAQLWSLIPFIGWVGGIWQLIIQIIGLKTLHETSYFRVIMAFLIPFFLIVSMVIATIILIVVFMGNAF